MAAITIRNLPASVHARLKQRAAAEGLSVEALVRGILASGYTLAAGSNEGEADTMPGFSEASAGWPTAPAILPASPAALWGALKGSVRAKPGTDLSAPLDESWEAVG